MNVNLEHVPQIESNDSKPKKLVIEEIEESDQSELIEVKINKPNETFTSSIFSNNNIDKGICEYLGKPIFIKLSTFHFL